MKKEILVKATANLLSLPPIINRTMRHKIVKTTATDVFERFTPIHTEIIWLIHDEGPFTISEVGNILMIAKAEMTQLVDKLVGLDVIERRAVKGDRRKIEIALTKNGKKALRVHRKNVRKWFMDAMSVLSDKDLRSLVKALTNVKNILSKLQ
jgi:DNA-binding MarR family transcriptional regulator